MSGYDSSSVDTTSTSGRRSARSLFVQSLYDAHHAGQGDSRVDSSLTPQTTSNIRNRDLIKTEGGLSKQGELFKNMRGMSIDSRSNSSNLMNRSSSNLMRNSSNLTSSSNNLLSSTRNNLINSSNNAVDSNHNPNSNSNNNNNNLTTPTTTPTPSLYAGVDFMQDLGDPFATHPGESSSSSSLLQQQIQQQKRAAVFLSSSRKNNNGSSVVSSNNNPRNNMDSNSNASSSINQYNQDLISSLGGVSTTTTTIIGNPDAHAQGDSASGRMDVFYAMQGPNNNNISSSSSRPGSSTNSTNTTAHNKPRRRPVAVQGMPRRRPQDLRLLQPVLPPIDREILLSRSSPAGQHRSYQANISELTDEVFVVTEDNNDDQYNENKEDYLSKPSPEQQQKGEEHQRKTQHTAAACGTKPGANKNDQLHIMKCQTCEVKLWTMKMASLVICPRCSGVTPNQRLIE